MMPPLPKCPTQTFLAIASTLGFYAVLFFLLIHGMPTSGSEVVLVMVGVAGTAYTGVMSYNFGSSLGSKAKENIMQDMNKNPPQVPPQQGVTNP